MRGCTVGRVVVPPLKGPPTKDIDDAADGVGSEDIGAVVTAMLQSYTGHWRWYSYLMTP